MQPCSHAMPDSDLVSIIRWHPRSPQFESAAEHRENKDRGGDGKNGVLASSRSYFYECGVLRFVLQQDSQHSKSPFKKTTKPRYRYRKSETHTQPTPRSNRSTARSSQRKTSPWHPHDVPLPPSILTWPCGTLPWLQPALPRLLSIGPSSFWRTPTDGVFCAAAHLHQQLHDLGRPVAPTLSSAHLSAPPVG